MGGRCLPGPLGTEPISAGCVKTMDIPNQNGLQDFAGPTGGHEAFPMRQSPVVGKVIKDWKPPKPDTTPLIVLRGNTLEAVFNELNANGRWGFAGGSIQGDFSIPAGSQFITVSLQGNLLKQLPEWTHYKNASAEDQKEWDRMMTALDKHEQRHVDIAIEECDNLADKIHGRKMDVLGGLITKANGKMKRRQEKYDKKTDHGEKEGVTLNF